jgi:hypothetical protein
MIIQNAVLAIQMIASIRVFQNMTVSTLISDDTASLETQTYYMK